MEIPHERRPNVAGVLSDNVWKSRELVAKLRHVADQIEKIHGPRYMFTDQPVELRTALDLLSSAIRTGGFSAAIVRPLVESISVRRTKTKFVKIKPSEGITINENGTVGLHASMPGVE